MDTAGYGVFVILSQGSTDFSVYNSQGSIYDIPLFNNTGRSLDYIKNYVCFDIEVLAGNVSIVDC